MFNKTHADNWCTDKKFPGAAQALLFWFTWHTEGRETPTKPIVNQRLGVNACTIKPLFVKLMDSLHPEMSLNRSGKVLCLAVGAQKLKLSSYS